MTSIRTLAAAGSRGRCSYACSLWIAVALSTMAQIASGQSCPPEFGQGQICSANDFNVTGVVVDGPGACTEGETISLTLRVSLESTARQRYDIGLFVGNDGEPVLGGSSCTHTALVPLEPVFDPDSGSGGYRDLDGDACGDVASGDGVVQRDFRLESVSCRDDDGDGRLDISGLVTWSINATQDVCSDPADPASFFPDQSSKCQLNPDYNLPIIVEPPPLLQVSKVALPANRPAPGGAVVFFVVVRNASAATDVLTLESLEDDIHGDLDGRGSCSVPQQLAPGEFYLCRFSATVTGAAGYSETDTVTVVAVDDDGERLSAADSATVTLTDAPATMAVVKGVSPEVVPEPGGTVSYSILVANTSDTESITVTDLDDDLYGDVFGKAGCAQPGPAPVLGPGEYILCSFEEQVAGVPGDVITDTITATASSGGSTLQGSDSASVRIADVSSAIEVTKTASPATVEAPGGDIRFGLQVTNVSPTDSVTIDRLVDTVYGDVTVVQGDLLATDCRLPRVLAPAQGFSCGFTGRVSGAAGSFHLDYIVASGADDDGVPVRALARAQVDVVATTTAVGIPVASLPWLAATALLLAGAGQWMVRGGSGGRRGLWRR